MYENCRGFRLLWSICLYIKSAQGQQDKVQVTYCLYQEHVHDIIKDLKRYLQLLFGTIYKSLSEILAICQPFKIILLRQLF